MTFRIDKECAATQKALLTDGTITSGQSKISPDFIEFPKSVNKSDIIKGAELEISFPISTDKAIDENKITREKLKATSGSSNSKKSSRSESREDFRTKLKETHDEFDIDEKPLTEEEIQEKMKFYGVSREKAIEMRKQYVEQNKKYNEMLKNTKASNGMTLTEAKRAYMDLYMKYIENTSVTVPWVCDNGREKFIGGGRLEVDPEKIEEHMSSEDRELFQKAKAAIAEFQQNAELMEAYKHSNTHFMESEFNHQTFLDGSGVRSWKAFAQKHGLNPYSPENYNPNDPLVWMHSGRYQK